MTKRRKRKKSPVEIKQHLVLVTDAEKAAYIRENFDISALVDSGWFHRDCEPLKAIVRWGQFQQCYNSLGFHVPVATNGPDKGKPDSIRYLNLILSYLGLAAKSRRVRFSGKVLRLWSLRSQWLSCEPLPHR